MSKKKTWGFRFWLTDALAIRRRVYGDEHPSVSDILNNLGEGMVANLLIRYTNRRILEPILRSAVDKATRSGAGVGQFPATPGSNEPRNRSDDMFDSM